MAELRVRRILAWYWLTRYREHLVRVIVWRMPRAFVYWAVIRCWAHATTGQYGNQHPDEITWHDALRRWDES